MEHSAASPCPRRVSRAARRGRAPAPALALLALLLAVAGLALWAWLARTSEPGGASAEPAQAEAATASPTDASRAEPASRAPAASGPLARPAERSERALGTIRGRVSPPKGEVLPELWTAVVEPSELYASGPVPTRRLEVRGGRADFEFRELPLGGYRVRAELPRWNAIPADVALVPGSTTQIVSLPLSATGFVDGSILDAVGRPAAGVELWLERRSDGLRVETSSAADGTFVFRDVRDGEHLLFVGPPEAPLLAPLELAFAAPSLRVPRLDLPPTASLLVWTLDRVGDAVPDVLVEGFGKPAGRVRGTSDGRGRFERAWLQPGRWRVSAESPDGRGASTDLDLAAGQALQVELRLLAR